MLFDENNPIKVILADDHEIVRAGIKRLLSVDKSIKILNEAANGLQAVEYVKSYQPNVVILDILMPQMTGIEAIREIKKDLPNIFTIMLTAFEDAQHLELALNAGADGYLSKDIQSRDLINAIHEVLEGKRVFSKSILSILNNNYISREEAEAPPVSITKREEEVLFQISEGKTNQEIADDLKLSIRTVESHRYNIMQKLNIKNTAQLIKYSVTYKNSFLK